MKRRHWLLWGLLAVSLSLQPFSRANDDDADAPMNEPEAKKFEDFAKLVKGAKVYDGLFKLHRKDDHLYAEIRPEQFNRPLLAPMAIARGLARGGETLNGDDQWVLTFQRQGDRVFLVRKNTRFTSRKDAPVAKAVETGYTDSVLLSLRIRSINPMKQSVVVDFGDIFLRDFAELKLGMLDRDRTTWHKIKVFPKNLELQVAATFSGRGSGINDSVIDERGTTVIVHYSLLELPSDGYQPRIADDRVGHFVTAVKDYSTDSKDTAFVRYVNRWRLERADGSAWKEGGKLSPPKKKIIFWIEKSVPDEYREHVRSGILEWNKAFEKIGFRDAIEVRQQETEDFDPEDANFNTFRWITTDQGFAIGPSRVNPYTGEILDADILFDASMVQFYKQERAIFGLDGPNANLSLIGATKAGELLPGGWNDRADASKYRAVRKGLCQCAGCKHQEIALGSMALALGNVNKPGDKVQDELIGQVIKETTMHEIGHTLGFRHNFKASTMLKNDQLHDVALTRKQGLVGSVMDYNPINLAPKGKPQGDFFSTTIGPYDYWVVEYAYKPIGGGTQGELEELKKLANKSATPGLDYGTDEDMYGAHDPHTNVWDLGADPLQFATERMALAEELMKGLADRITDKGEGYQRTRQAFGLLLRQYADAAVLALDYVGGEHLHRDHRDDPKARDPLTPVEPARQRQALAFLQKYTLTDKPFAFPPDVLRKLAADRWYHWGNESAIFNVDYPIYERILSIQALSVRTLLNPSTLARVQNQALKFDAKTQVLTLAEIFRTLSESIWADLPALNKDAPVTVPASLMRRNLQRVHLQQLSGLVLRLRGGPADARSLARMHLREIGKRLDAALGGKPIADDATRAHYEEVREQITKVLSASVQANEP
jgi:hypothetical protein